MVNLAILGGVVIFIIDVVLIVREWLVKSYVLIDYPGHKIIAKAPIQNADAFFDGYNLMSQSYPADDLVVAKTYELGGKTICYKVMK